MHRSDSNAVFEWIFCSKSFNAFHLPKTYLYKTIETPIYSHVDQC